MSIGVVLHFLRGEETYFNFISFWLIFSNILKMAYNFKIMICIEQRQENSAFTTRYLKQNMINLSLGGVFMVFIFEHKNQSLKHIHWLITEPFMGQYRATNDHRYSVQLCSCGYMLMKAKYWIQYWQEGWNSACLLIYFLTLLIYSILLHFLKNLF